MELENQSAINVYYNNIIANLMVAWPCAILTVAVWFA